jgi:hypothetical protein
VSAAGTPTSPPPTSPPVSPPASPPPTIGFGVTKLTLVNAATNKDIGTISNGMTIDFSGGKTYSVRADTTGTTKSVVFKVDGATVRVEGARPYAIAGDLSATPGSDVADYLPWSISNGAHVLNVQGFSLANGSGSAGLGVSLTVNIIGA